MEGSKRVSLPMQHNVDLRKSQRPTTPAVIKRMSGIPSDLDLGSIIYVIRRTRPDVAFTQNLTSRYQQNPGESHRTTVKNILKYMRNTKEMFLGCDGSDASWVLNATQMLDSKLIKMIQISIILRFRDEWRHT